MYYGEYLQNLFYYAAEALAINYLALKSKKQKSLKNNSTEIYSFNSLKFAEIAGEIFAQVKLFITIELAAKVQKDGMNEE